MTSLIRLLMLLLAVSIFAFGGNALAEQNIGRSVLLGGDLTDMDNVHDENAYSVADPTAYDPLVDNLGGFDAVFNSTYKADFNSENAFNLFDNVIGSSGAKVCCAGLSIAVDADFSDTTGERYVLTHFSITSDNDSGINRDPDIWKIQGSNDGTTFTDIFTYNKDGNSPFDDFGGSPEYRTLVYQGPSGPTTATYGQDFATPQPYSMFRYLATSAVTGNHALNELEFFGVPERLEIGGDALTGVRDETASQIDVTSPLLGAKTLVITQNKSDTIQISELQAFDTADTNVALQSNGATATATSQYNTTFVPNKAIDGSISGSMFWHSATTDLVGAELTVTLSDVTDLDSVHIWGRHDCCPGRQDDFDLTILDGSGTTIYDERITGVGSDPGSNRSIIVGNQADVTATLLDDVTYVFEIADETTADQLNVLNDDPARYTTILDVNNATLELELLGEEILGVWDILEADSIVGQFDAINLPTLTTPAYYWDISNLYITGQVQLRVPEPTSLMLFAFAFVGLFAVGRRRRKKQ